MEGNKETRERQVYVKLLKHYNRGSAEQIICDCGKIITKNILTKHLESKTHKFLGHYKKRAEESEIQTTETKPAPIANSHSMWNKVCNG